MDKFSEELENAADTFGDALATLQDLPDLNDYMTDDELDKCWDAYQILMDVSMLITNREEE